MSFFLRSVALINKKDNNLIFEVLEVVGRIEDRIGNEKKYSE